jgi:hypothetical protein
MSIYPPIERRSWDHVPNHLVVAIPDKSLVLGYIDETLGLTVSEGPPDESPELDLALIQITNLDEREQALRDLVDACEATSFAWLPVPGPDAGPLDRVLFLVRWHFADQYGGWTPTMAKNYDTETVTGLPHIDGVIGAADPAYYPSAAAPTELHWSAPELGAGIKVGIVDTPLYEAPLLRAKYMHKYLPTEPWPADGLPHWAIHGVMSAGLIVQQARGVELTTRPALDPKTATGTIWDLAKCMASLRGSGVSIVNVSAGCLTWDGRPPFVLERAIDALWPEILVVAAVGNHGSQPVAADDSAETLTPTSPMYPSAQSRVVAVGSYVVDDKGDKFRANFNPEVPWQVLVAKGVNVASTCPVGPVTIQHVGQRLANSVPSTTSKMDDELTGVAYWSGSSFATAIVTGAIAARMTGGVSAQKALEVLMTEAVEGVDGIWTYEAAKYWPKQPNPPRPQSTPTTQE